MGPSSASQMRAVFPASEPAACRSTQLWAMLTRPPINQVAHSGPALVSSTCSYGRNHSIPRSFSAADQYQAGSRTDAATRSS